MCVCYVCVCVCVCAWVVDTCMCERLGTSDPDLHAVPPTTLESRDGQEDEDVEDDEGEIKMSDILLART